MQTWRGSFSVVSTPIFQLNIRWKVLDEMHKMSIILHRSGLKMSAKFRPNCLLFHLLNLFVPAIVAIIMFKFDEVVSEFHEKFQKNDGKLIKIMEICSVLPNFAKNFVSEFFETDYCVNVS